MALAAVVCRSPVHISRYSAPVGTFASTFSGSPRHRGCEGVVRFRVLLVRAFGDGADWALSAFIGGLVDAPACGAFACQLLSIKNASLRQVVIHWVEFPRQLQNLPVRTSVRPAEHEVLEP